MNRQISISVFTGSRAEYGLMRRLLSRLESESSCLVSLIVSGSHLSVSHGYTIEEILKDGRNASFKIYLPDGMTMAEQAAVVISGCCEAFRNAKPDVMIVLGDRYETFAAVSAAYLSGIPVAHLHGGETTEGALDDGLRHAMTQMATWHFTAAFPYLEYVRQLGADHERSFCVGPMAVDSIKEEVTLTRDQFEAATGFQFDAINLLVTYHSVTRSSCLGLSGFKALLEVLENQLKTKGNIHILFTYPNLDQGGHEIIALMHRFVDDHPGSCWVVPSLGQSLYLSALKLFTVMLGNSSSGIIEAPLSGLPVVNIGPRQQGRLRYGDVFDTAEHCQSIQSALNHAMLVALEGKRNPTLFSTMFPTGSPPSEIIAAELLSAIAALRPHSPPTCP